MLCQRCKKNIATEHFADIINGELIESHLCAKCNAEMAVGLNSKINDAVCSWLFGSSAQKKVCPVCGMNYSEYEKKGLLGCASCYDVFKDELLPAIRAIHGKVEHVGQVGLNKDDLGLHRRLKSLQEQLELALREKRFADAGVLNKKIYDINKTLHGDSENGEPY